MPSSPGHPFRVRVLAALLDQRSAGAFSREYRLIAESQWLSPPRILELQFERLRALLRHAEATVPFYTRWFADHGIRAASVTSPADFARLPPLPKATVVANASGLLSTAGRPSLLTQKATGGSTGERMVFYRDADAMSRNFAHVLRNYTWTGLDLGDPHAFLWGAHFDLRAQQRLSNRLINFCLRQRWLDAFRMNEASMAGYVADLGRWKPRLLSAYVTAAATLSDFALRRGASIQVPAIATTAETLFPKHRQQLRAAFGAEIFDRYGCREIGNTAHECPDHSGLHVNAEHVYLEIVDGENRPVPPGQEGDVLYTSLGNWRFPLIRYRVGDRAVAASAGACRCGRGLPKIAAVRGRETDMLVTPDGTRVHGEYFSHLFYGLASVLEFRVVQESAALIRIWVRVAGGASALPSGDEATLRSAFMGMFGKGTDLEIMAVDEIPKTASGKRRFTESRIAGSAV